MALQELDADYKRFIDKSTILFGETGTGKSFVITDILFQLQPYVEQVIVISPTDRQNHTYDSGIVPIPCIHYTITAQLLEDIWERQNALVSVYTRANKPQILRQLFDRIPDNRQSRSIIDSINAKLQDYRLEIENESDPAILDMETKCKELIALIFKQSINANRSKLQKMDLSKDEQYSLKYLNLNPRLVLIFDDCTDLMKKFKSHPVVQKLFYQGRWAYITTIIACHTDKALDPELKKNAFVSIFTEESCAHAYFKRDSSSLDRAAKERAASAIKYAFTPLAKHQKLVWIRDEKKFYRFTAAPHEKFRFGSPYIWEFCGQIQAEAGAVASDNKFMYEFI